MRRIFAWALRKRLFVLRTIRSLAHARLVRNTFATACANKVLHEAIITRVGRNARLALRQGDKFFYCGAL